jgi:NADH dehydrogenase FAD-containing subunit
LANDRWVRLAKEAAMTIRQHDSASPKDRYDTEVVVGAGPAGQPLAGDLAAAGRPEQDADGPSGRFRGMSS